MNIEQRIDYMIQCLIMAKEEVRKLKEYNVYYHHRGSNEHSEYLKSHRKPNKAFLKDNLRNVGRECFNLSNGLLNGLCDVSKKTCNDCQWYYMNGGTCKKRTMCTCDQFISYKWEKTDSSIDEI